jgi:hypothetical protein
LGSNTILHNAVIVAQFLKRHGRSGITRELPLPERITPLVKIYRHDELARFFATCSDTERSLFATFLLTGFREQEVMFLRWSDVNFELRTVRVTSKPELGCLGGQILATAVRKPAKVLEYGIHSRICEGSLTSWSTRGRSFRLLGLGSGSESATAARCIFWSLIVAGLTFCVVGGILVRNALHLSGDAGRRLGQQLIYKGHKRRAVDRLPEKSTRAFVQIEGFRSGGWLSGNNDYRDFGLAASDTFKEFESAHLPLPHLDIRDYAIAPGRSVRCEEDLGRRECLSNVPV